jgi:hypothetical protein
MSAYGAKLTHTAAHYFDFAFNRLEVGNNSMRVYVIGKSGSGQTRCRSE